MKNRAKGDDNGSGEVRNSPDKVRNSPDKARNSAVATLRFGLNILLRLFAPMLPYITEEVWSWVFAAETGHASIHIAPWPGTADFKGITSAKDPAVLDAAVACLAAIHKAKSQAGVSLAKPIKHLTLAGHPASLEQLQFALTDVLAATRTTQYTLKSQPELTEQQFMVLKITF